MSMNLGYLVGTAIFRAVFVAAVVAQIRAKKFHPLLHWGTIIASTTVLVAIVILVLVLPQRPAQEAH